jgi:hypothetical protein
MNKIVEVERSPFRPRTARRSPRGRLRLSGRGMSRGGAGPRGRAAWGWVDWAGRRAGAWRYRCPGICRVGVAMTEPKFERPS